MFRYAFEKHYTNLNKILVSESALRFNLNLFRKLVPSQSICPVIKSNAYGHDLELVAKILEKENPDFFIVDSIYEGYQLKAVRIKTPILVMGYSTPENLKRKHPGFHFAAFDPQSAEALARIKAPVHLKIDTGLTRMGFSLDDLRKHLKKLKKMNLKVEGVFSHLADADNAHNNTYTKEQIDKFKVALELIREAGFTPKWIHLSASGGALKVHLPELNLVRLGLSLYGINPYSIKDPYYKKLKELKPVMEMRSTLTAIRDISKGQKVGYAGAFVATRKMTLGVVAAGYYEALPRSLGNKGWVEIRGKLCPILGRVCMNYVIVDMTGLKAKILDPVTVFSMNRSKKNSIERAASLAGSIPNEILVRICENLVRERVA